MREGKPIRVAIIGGGCSSIAAAFELSRPEHKGKYEITIYQVGWRLGGKGASGRGPADRIEEHGFHVWMGMYENAFRLMRECYRELNRDRATCRIADWRDAFFPAPFIGLAQAAAKGRVHNFVSYFPPDEDSLPGDPITVNNNPFSVAAYLVRIASLLRTILLTTVAPSPERPKDHISGGRLSGRSANLDESRERLAERVAGLLKLGLVASTAGIIEALGILEMVFGSPSRSLDNLTLPLLEKIASGARRLLEGVIDDDPQLSLAWQAIDLGIAAMLGMVRFGLLSDPRGFDVINDYDFREWIKLNGASQRSIDSPLVRACYDLVFAYENGDHRRPRHGAGVGLRGSLRLIFSSRGAIFWKMRAGMGDVVFAPFYEVLKRRGVSFQFFHRLERVRLPTRAELAPGERPYIQALEFDIQALNIRNEYQPLVEVDGLPCWPSKPDFSQLVHGARMEREGRDFESYWDRRKVATKTLQVVKDFDFVVLGIGLGAIPNTCRELIQSDRRWRDMVAHIGTVETQAVQIWMRDDMETLGWKNPPVSLSAFVHPFETWADMGHLIDEERWPTKPQALAYFCSPLPQPRKRPDISDAYYPARRRSEVRRNAIHFLNNHVARLWPTASRRKGGFKWEVLVDHRERSPGQKGAAKGDARFDSQYWRANVNPTDRYVLSLPGTQKYRISPLDNTYDNLTIAGDWTASGLDTGCVEAAIISGRLAAHAISSLPALEDIVGYDHP